MELGWEAARSERLRSHPLTHLGPADEALEVLAGARDELIRLGDDVEAARCDIGTAYVLIAGGHHRAARPVLQSARETLLADGLDDEADWCWQLMTDPAAAEHDHRSGPGTAAARAGRGTPPAAAPWRRVSTVRTLCTAGPVRAGA